MKLKRLILLGILFLELSFISANPQINLINITPNLDFTRFNSYDLIVNITNTSSINSVKINVSGINGQGEICWDYYINGTCNSENLIFNMNYDSINIWKKEKIYPDYIYPEIFFAPSIITWNNLPSNISLRRKNYHLFNFTNSFTMVENMSFWIEFNALATSSTSSSDLFVYIIGNGSNSIGLDYFTSDWRTKSNTELVSTISRKDSFNHIHTTNSSHKLITLSTNKDGTIGNKSLNVSSNFWVVLYQDSNNINRGWNLRYQSPSVCSNQNSWYTAERTVNGAWNIPVAQLGCPDVHIHIARDNLNYRDGVNTTVLVIDENLDVNISSQSFYYNELPNLAPTHSSFTNPIFGKNYNVTYINITWNPSTDPNEDILTYNISLLNSDLSFNQTLDTTLITSYYWNTTDILDGEYNLKLEVCDDEIPSLCVNSTLEGNFVLNKTISIYNLSSISVISNNTINSSLANSKDLIKIYFNSSGPLINPNVTIYSGGYSINNLIVISNQSNYYNSSYIVNSIDVDGAISFEIKADNLDYIYSFTTDNTRMNIDKAAPNLDIISPLVATYTSTNQLLNISVTDNHLSTIWYNWNGINTTYTSAINIVFLEGSNIIYVWANDSLGNLNSTNITFMINSPEETQTLYSYLKVYYSDENFTQKGNFFRLKHNEKIKFIINSTNHTLTLLNFDLNTARIKIESEPIIKYLTKGVNYEIDINFDGIEDIQVKYDKIIENKAEIFIKEIFPLNVQEITNQQLDIPVLNKEEKSFYWIIFFLIILFSLSILFFKRKKKRRYKLFGY